MLVGNKRKTELKKLLNCSIPCLLLGYTLQSEIFRCVPLGSESVIQHHLDHSTSKENQRIISLSGGFIGKSFDAHEVIYQQFSGLKWKRTGTAKSKSAKFSEFSNPNNKFENCMNKPSDDGIIMLQVYFPFTYKTFANILFTNFWSHFSYVFGLLPNCFCLISGWKNKVHTCILQFFVSWLREQSIYMRSTHFAS